MKKGFKTGAGGRWACMLICACAAVAQMGSAQSPSTTNSGQPSGTNKPKNQQEVNPFPDDVNAVPVLPSANSPATAAPDVSDYPAAALPGTDGDPVKSPDDAASSTAESGSSSSSAGLDNLRAPADEEQQTKRGRGGAQEPLHTESAKDDENVGSYYLDQKNWRAALSRFESAVVLDPENPDVYWGLAESQRHMGDFVNAKANYLKVMDYDPDSKHSKEAKKILNEPEMAGAKGATASASPQRH